MIMEEKFFTLRRYMLSLKSVSEFQPHNRFKDCAMSVFVIGAETRVYGLFGIVIIIHWNCRRELSSGTVSETTGYEPLPIGVIIYRIDD